MKLTALDGGSVVGAEAIGVALQHLSANAATRLVRRGLFAFSATIRDEARVRAPVRKKWKLAKDGSVSRAKAKGGGNLKRAIQAQTRGVFRNASGKPVMHRAVVIVDKKKRRPGNRSARSYAWYVHHGTQPHKAGGRYKGAMHPGARAQPFMREAFIAKRFAGFQAMLAKVREDFPKLAAEARNKAGNKLIRRMLKGA